MDCPSPDSSENPFKKLSRFLGRDKFFKRL